MRRRTEPNGAFEAAVAEHQQQTTLLREAVKQRRESPDTPIGVPTMSLLDAAREVLRQHPCDCEACQLLTTFLR